VVESAPIKASPFAVPDSKQDLLGDGGRGPKQRRAATNCHGESEGREPPFRNQWSSPSKGRRRPGGGDMGCRREEVGAAPGAI